MAETPWKFIRSGSPECLPKVSARYLLTHWWYDGRPHKFGWQPPKDFCRNGWTKTSSFGVSGMRPFMDGIIENKVGNSLDSSLENREGDTGDWTKRGSHRDWDLETTNSFQTRELVTFPIIPSLFNLTCSTFFQPRWFPTYQVSFSFSFLTSHPTPSVEAIGRNEFAFYFSPLALNIANLTGFQPDGPLAATKELPDGEMWRCLEILAKKTTTEKPHVFCLKELRIYNGVLDVTLCPSPTVMPCNNLFKVQMM